MEKEISTSLILNQGFRLLGHYWRRTLGALILSLLPVLILDSFSTAIVTLFRKGGYTEIMCLAVPYFVSGTGFAVLVLGWTFMAWNSARGGTLQEQPHPRVARRLFGYVIYCVALGSVVAICITALVIAHGTAEITSLSPAAVIALDIFALSALALVVTLAYGGALTPFFIAHKHLSFGAALHQSLRATKGLRLKLLGADFVFLLAVSLVFNVLFWGLVLVGGLAIGGGNVIGIAIVLMVLSAVESTVVSVLLGLIFIIALSTSRGTVYAHIQTRLS